VTSTDTGILTATSPEQARHTWPRRLAAGAVLVAVAVVGLLWSGAGARLLLGAAGVAALVRGVLVLRAAAAGAVDEQARPLGSAAGVLGAAAVVVAVVSAGVSGRVLVVGVPVLLFLAAAALLPRGGAVRLGGRVLLVWSALVTALLVAAGATGGWDRAAAAATVVGGVGLAVLGVAAVAGAFTLRAVAGQAPAPGAYPAAPGGCAGCACGAGGCGAVGG
jgi:hypothetical protein